MPPGGVQGSDTDELTEAATGEAGDGRLWSSRRLRLLLRLTPWVSLALSVFGAVWMERDRQAAGAVTAAVAGSWLTMSVALWLRRRWLPGSRALAAASRPPAPPAQLPEAKLRALARVADFAGFALTQSLAQLPVFFSGPFYALAFGWHPLQAAFLALFAGVGVVVTWDPLAERALFSPRLGAPVLGFCWFTGLRVALPMLGLRHSTALGLSLAAVTLLTAADLRLRWPTASPARRLAATVAVAAGLAMLSPIIPAAPMHLVDAGIGAAVEDHQLIGRATQFPVGTRLVCWTAIYSPRHTEGVLRHYWSRDGEPLAKLDLEIRGGRERGYRTFSRLLAARPGEYRCQVRTTVGQVLGARSAQVR